MEGQQLKYWLAFNRIHKITPARLKKIIYFFNNDLEKAWSAPLESFLSAKIEEAVATEIIINRGQIDPDAELAQMQKHEIKATTIADADYPRLLQEIPDYPPLIYYRGDISICQKNSLAIVGSRNFTSYGQQVTNNLTGQLTACGLVIISGLALGIDALAHQACLESHGLTVGVLGSGLDWPTIYPSANRYLAKKIIESGGCLISEYPAGTIPTKYNFPLRNRIIAGLSLGTLVIEAAESSGSLITAKCALEYNREVFAVPGSIFNSRSAGTNNLIKQGAKLVTDAADILEELKLAQLIEINQQSQPLPASDEEKIILQNLSEEPLHIDKLSKLCNIKINVLSGLLMILEMKCRIKNVGGQNYISLH